MPADLPPFLIYGLPRSRTFWLSKLLCYRDWHCGHDEIRHVRALEDVTAWFSQPCTGTVETAAAAFWRLVPGHVRQVVVRRPVDQVMASLVRNGFPAEIEPIMRRLDTKLDQIERRVPGVLSVTFDELATEDGCRRVWEHCLPYSFDRAWWEMVAPLCMEVSLVSQVRYMQAHAKQIARLTGVAKAQMLATLPQRRMGIDGFTIQQEPFADFLRDGVHLFERHCAAVGEHPDNWATKNIPLMQVLYDMGALQMTTARSNGRMFGYLMAVMSPSLESPDVMSAMHLLFYADPAAPGIGMKMQRSSIAALKARGIGEIFWRAGVRGDGPRLDAMYRRLGAQPFGELFRLEMKEAA